MKLLRRQVETQCVCHLPRGLTARTSIGHREGDGDAVGGEEQVFVSSVLTQRVVEVESEVGVAGDDGIEI